MCAAQWLTRIAQRGKMDRRRTPSLILRSGQRSSRCHCEEASPTKQSMDAIISLSRGGATKAAMVALAARTARIIRAVLAKGEQYCAPALAARSG
jgi:hypothetical protein